MIGAGLVFPKGRHHRRVLAAAVFAEAAAALNEVLADLVDLLERLGHDLAFVAARAGVAKPASALEVIAADLQRDVTRGAEVPGVVLAVAKPAVLAVRALASVSEEIADAVVAPAAAAAATAATLAAALAVASVTLFAGRVARAGVILAVGEAAAIAVLAAATLLELEALAARRGLDGLALGVGELALVAEAAPAGVAERSAHFFSFRQIGRAHV